nr:MAG TPA_asm: hypothetical protein [Bacteriophage sp.]
MEGVHTRLNMRECFACRKSTQQELEFGDRICPQ